MYTVLLFIIFFGFIYMHPTPSNNCNGFQQNINYHYHFKTFMSLNNNDHMGKEPVGFGYRGSFYISNIWQYNNNYILQINGSGFFTNRKGEEISDTKQYPLYVYYENGKFKEFYYNIKDTLTSINIKKAISKLLYGNKFEMPGLTWSKQGREIYIEHLFSDDHSKPIVTPLIIDNWKISSKLSRDHSFVSESYGWQNISLMSKLYDAAYSKVYLTYTINLAEQTPITAVTESEMSSIKYVNQVIEQFGDDYVANVATWQREKKLCHDCKTFNTLVKEYEKHLDVNEMASIPATIAYLKLLERIRSGGPGMNKEEILKVLKETQKQAVLSSILDILAGSRTENGIIAALEFLDLPSNDNLELTERFLISISVSCLIGAKSNDEFWNNNSSLEFILRELLKSLHASQWKSQKLRWTALLTLGSVMRAHNSLAQVEKLHEDELNKKVTKQFIDDLSLCEDDVDCLISITYAFGSMGNLMLSYETLQKIILDTKLKRVSVAALRAIEDGLKYLFERCKSIENCLIKYLDRSVIASLKNTLGQIIFESKHESTSRIIATEIMIKYLNDQNIADSILQDKENFNNFEMTTMMWSRAIREKKSTDPLLNNWLHHSRVFNGSSAHFKQVMGKTSTMNTSYGITTELLQKGKIIKESLFEFEMSGNNSLPQHILSVNLLARGLGSVTGDGGEDESASAGMGLKVCGVQLRPYTLFTGKGELMGHVWSGTAKNPITVYEGNLLFSDYNRGLGLINGFVVEEEYRGVLSIELTGQIEISLWNRNSNSLVKTKGSLLIQGSQSILTSDPNTKISQKFAFGGSTSLNLITDADFYTSPFKHCLQMQQPDLIIRHNTRKYEQVNEDKATRRIHRRNYYIPAKSFAFHSHNNEMCAIMKR